MPEAYPLLRRRRRRRRLRLFRIGRRAWIVAGAALALALVIGGFAAWRPGARIDPRQAYAEGVAAYRTGNYSAARNHAQAAIGAAPATGPAHLLLARAYLQHGDGLAAEAELTRAADTGISADLLHGYRAQARFLQGDLDGALDEVGKATADDMLAIRIHARALGVQGDNDQATALLADVVARHPDDGGAWTDLGRVRLAAGDVGEAARASAQAIRVAPADPVALTLQGEVIRTRYGLIAALPWFEAALKHDAYYHPALIEYAATLGDAGRAADMLAATRKALAARPGSPQALYLQAVLAMRAGKPDLARTLLQTARGGLDDLPGAMLLQGDLAFVGGKDEIAIRQWRALAAVQPMNVMVRRLLGAALLRSGDARGALDALKPVAIRGDADSYTLALVARAFEAIGDRGMAAQFLDRAASAARAPSTVFAPDQAMGALLADAAQAPGDPTYIAGVIRGQIASGDIAGGIAQARVLAETAPGAPAAQLALGDALAAGGRYGEAVSVYTRAADLSFDEPTLLRLVDAEGRGRQAPRCRGDARALSSSEPAKHHGAAPARPLAGGERPERSGNRDARRRAPRDRQPRCRAARRSRTRLCRCERCADRTPLWARRLYPGTDERGGGGCLWRRARRRSGRRRCAAAVDQGGDARPCQSRHCGAPAADRTLTARAGHAMATR